MLLAAFREAGWVEASMAEVDRLEEQLRRTLEGEAWHGPSVLELLAGACAAQGGTPARPARAMAPGDRRGRGGPRPPGPRAAGRRFGGAGGQPSHRRCAQHLGARAASSQ